ncbi:hypothetical protein RSOLAG1IB_08421 [Rhizoctonia solani AG-1 IB]|uniref:Uncharacterized protein n=1 Tax=Thanatephorus cucumeris (strain AG1-IB / isolate 7/3/14) TaxID=1108050 RepID=A0A0B7FLV5_THACB|nr:hypothetical protein RSOLAG1IB_08421 [Rhizoctonia solani AG-1 IB]
MAFYESLYPLWAVDRGISKQVLSIFEFNPRIVKQCLYQRVKKDQVEILKGQAIVSDLTFTGTDLKNPMWSVDKAEMNQDIVTEIVDHKTKINIGFEEPIESSLPYMAVTRVQRFPVHRDWYMEGDYLVDVGALPDIQDGPRHPLSLYKLQISCDH